MGNKNTIKSTLLTLYKDGKTEDEAFGELIKIHSSKSISKITVSRWYQRFRSGDFNLDDSTKIVIKEKLTDEYLINLIKDNPESRISELAEIANISYKYMSKMLNKLNSGGEEIYKFKKVKKVSDEFIIDLVNSNPKLTLAKLAKLANITPNNLRARIDYINRDGEKINYVKKKCYLRPNEKPMQKFTDKYLIDLVNENPDLNMAELADIAGVCISTISKRIKKINQFGEKVSYSNKSIIKITDERIVELVNENPDLNIVKLAELANVSHTTVNSRIHNLSSKGKQVDYINKRTSGSKSETNNKPRTRQKFTDEYLINLMKENPGLNKVELAKLANVSYATMIRRIKQVNNNDKG